MTDDDPNEADAMLPMTIGLEQAARSPVNKLTWAQVGLVTEPGRYMFRFGGLTITSDDIAVWQQYPNAAFTLLRTVTMAQPGDEAEEEFRLGTFELRIDSNYSESEK
jgi:hypothetical protein